MVEQGGHALEGSGLLDFLAGVVKPPQGRARICEPGDHLLDDPLKAAQHVEAKTDRFEAGIVSRCPQQRQQVGHLEQKILRRRAHCRRFIHLAQDGLTEIDGRRIARRVCEDPLDETPIHGQSFTPDLELESVLDQLREEEVVREVSRVPLCFARRHAFENAVELTGGGAPEEGQVEHVGERFPVGTRTTSRKQQIGENHFGELTPGHPPRRTATEHPTNRRTEGGLFGAASMPIAIAGAWSLLRSLAQVGFEDSHHEMLLGLERASGQNFVEQRRDGDRPVDRRIVASAPQNSMRKASGQCNLHALRV